MPAAFATLSCRYRLVTGVRPDVDPLLGGGVPMFWAHAMLNSQTVRNIVQAYDVPVLKHLQVRIESREAYMTWE